MYEYDVCFRNLRFHSNLWNKKPQVLCVFVCVCVCFDCETQEIMCSSSYTMDMEWRCYFHWSFFFVTSNPTNLRTNEFLPTVSSLLADKLYRDWPWNIHLHFVVIVDVDVTFHCWSFFFLLRYQSFVAVAVVFISIICLVLDKMRLFSIKMNRPFVCAKLNNTYEIFIALYIDLYLEKNSENWMDEWTF